MNGVSLTDIAVIGPWLASHPRDTIVAAVLLIGNQ
jgi:hypothetical protein